MNTHILKVLLLHLLDRRHHCFQWNLLISLCSVIFFRWIVVKAFYPPFHQKMKIYELIILSFPLTVPHLALLIQVRRFSFELFWYTTLLFSFFMIKQQFSESLLSLNLFFSTQWFFLWWVSLNFCVIFLAF